MNEPTPTSNSGSHSTPSLFVSLLPIASLLACLIGIIVIYGSESISDLSVYALLGASAFTLGLTFITRSYNRRGMKAGFLRNARQILPTVPILACIALVSTTWMLSGIVPVMISFGLSVLNPTFFLVTTCIVCSAISVLTGSSWTTVATIGMAFMGIGAVMGFNAAMVAGAVISGAYFGDKMSPLSDTTVLASSSCGVDLFEHIRYIMLTTVPAIGLTLIIFLILGITTEVTSDADASGMVDGLNRVFNLTPWVLVIPAVTGILIALRIPTIITLAASWILGFIGIIVFQPEVCAEITSGAASAAEHVQAYLNVLLTDFAISTGDAKLDELVATGGIAGMMPTIKLILAAMVFGGVLMGSGMLSAIARAFTSRIKKRTPLVGVTIGSGLMLNAGTADQYLALIISGNMYRSIYRRMNLEPRLLSRTLEDSVSVTSVLVPWNTCGLAQSTVLGMSTFAYVPFCFFNYLCPLMSFVFAWTGLSIRKAVTKKLRPATVTLKNRS